LGELELLMGDPAGGRRDLETATRLNPYHAEASRRLAEILVGENRYTEAEPLLQVSLRKHPDDPWALSYAALGELQQRKLEEAAATARKVHSLPHQQYASAHMIAARALELLNFPDQAAAEYNTYLAEAPAGDNAERARAALKRLQPSSDSPR
jgi:predicted Zn-dependent protease